MPVFSDHRQQGWSNGSLVRPTWRHFERPLVRTLRVARPQIGGVAPDQTRRCVPIVPFRGAMAGLTAVRGTRRTRLITVGDGGHAQAGRARNYEVATAGTPASGYPGLA